MANVYIKKGCQINNLTLHLKELGIEEKNKSKANKRKEILNITAKINKIENRKTIEKIDETGSLFFEKVNKIDKPLE